MNIWLSEEWRSNTALVDFHKEGLRCYFDSRCSFEVKKSCKRFSRWLRNNFHFPVKVLISFMAYDSIEATDGDYVSALFVEPFMGPEYPHIYIAVGDYDVQKKEAGQDNALGGILRSVAHELTHYYQWLNGIKLTETGYERQARYYADVIVGWYSTSYEHP